MFDRYISYKILVIMDKMDMTVTPKSFQVAVVASSVFQIILCFLILYSQDL